MATLKEIHGNIFASDCDVLVNTVNCAGVMGAGIALEFKYRFPGLFDFYRSHCEQGKLRPGNLLWYTRSSPVVLCFPTKDDWKLPSRLQFIEAGLMDLARTYGNYGISSLAMPRLGSSLGGLDWRSEVRPVVYQHLEPLSGLKVEIYSFDPKAQDPLIQSLGNRLAGLTAEEIASKVGVTVAQARRIRHAFDEGTLNGIVSIGKIDGIGEKAIGKIVRFAREPEVGPAQQKLNFGV